MDNEQELKDKAAYAAFLLQSKGDAFKAAQLLYPGDTGKALRIAKYWPIDLVVVLERQRLIDTGEDIKFVPSKVEVLNKVWEIIDNDKIDPRDRLVASKLYAEMMGFIKPVDFVPPETLQRVPTYKLVNE